LSEGLGYPAEPTVTSRAHWLTRLRKHILLYKGPELETRSQQGLRGTVGEPENSAGPADAHGPSGYALRYSRFTEGSQRQHVTRSVSDEWEETPSKTPQSIISHVHNYRGFK
jgi:hypothetical protein